MIVNSQIACIHSGTVQCVLQRSDCYLLSTANCGGRYVPTYVAIVNILFELQVLDLYCSCASSAKVGGVLLSEMSDVVKKGILDVKKRNLFGSVSFEIGF